MGEVYEYIDTRKYNILVEECKESLSWNDILKITIAKIEGGIPFGTRSPGAYTSKIYHLTNCRHVATLPKNYWYTNDIGEARE